MSLHTLPIPLSLIFLLGVLAVAAYTDIRHRKIRNWLVATGLVGLWLIQFADAGWFGFKESLWGFAIAFVVTAPLVMLRVFGAGDSKLMLVVGSAVGISDFFLILAFSIVLSGLMALAGSLLVGRAKVFGANLSIGITSAMYRDWATAKTVAEHTAYRVPFALPVSVGVLIWLYWFY